MRTKQAVLEERELIKEAREVNYQAFKAVFDKLLADKQFEIASDLSTIYHEAKKLSFDAGAVMVESHSF